MRDNNGFKIVLFHALRSAHERFVKSVSKPFYLTVGSSPASATNYELAETREATWASVTAAVVTDTKEARYKLLGNSDHFDGGLSTPTMWRARRFRLGVRVSCDIGSSWSTEAEDLHQILRTITTSNVQTKEPRSVCTAGKFNVSDMICVHVTLQRSRQANPKERRREEEHTSAEETARIRPPCTLGVTRRKREKPACISTYMAGTLHDSKMISFMRCWLVHGKPLSATFIKFAIKPFPVHTTCSNIDN